jgi:GH25 family lysozyme M1 (1,4-beta-N-acetylmuramidase)
MAGIKAENGGAAIIRACYGTSHPDRVFAKFRAAASGFSFLGIYAYLVAGQDAATQAKAFVKLVGHLGPHEIPILDLEEGVGDQSGRAAAWASVVDTAFGLASLPLNKRSWLYSYVDFTENHGLVPVMASARHTWIASYGSTEPTLGHTLWQCTDGIDGIHRTNWPGAGFCDTSIYKGALAQLAATIAR